MQVLVWIGLALCAVVLLIYFLQVATGFLVPRTVSGAALFVKEIKKYDIDPRKLPADFVRSLILQCDKISIAGKYMPGETRITYFHDLVVRSAYNIAAFIRGGGVSEDDPAIKLAREMSIKQKYEGLS